MKFPSVLLVALLLSSVAWGAEPFQGRIERFDPAFDRLVAADATIEKLAEGVRWAEGPVWLDGAVVFSDPATNTAYRGKPGASGLEEFLKPSGLLTPTPGFREPGSNGLALDPTGRLLLCQHGERRIARYEKGKFTSIADRYEGKRFNSPNDLVVRKNGDIYFTDPPYGLEGVAKSPLRELPFAGVYRVAKDGTVTLLTKELNFPNGIAFSPDEKRLYVNVSDGAATRNVVYEVQADGTIENGRTFFDLKSSEQLRGARGGFDGLKLDRDGNLWTSGPGGILVISPVAKLLGRFYTGVPTANCAWGGDGSTLYITANHFLLRIQTLTKGAGW